ncbi:FecR domain-containing protein [Negadavirga shengliensis]|uniref:FecR domain-containing protein n=1 Tax=Negadavirga shengliensis TaxID=1389218 RepID=A0ABV9T899_9BACT
MDQDFVAYFNKYLLDELKDEEITRFRLRLEEDPEFRKAFESYKRELYPSQAYPSFDKEQSWEKIKGQVHQGLAMESGSKRPLIGFFRIAATFLLVTVAAILLKNTFYSKMTDHPVSMITKTTAFGQKSTIVLPDETTVRLNSGSTIVYPEYFDEKTRRVEITGEAFFDVIPDHGRPFQVISGTIKTSVVGTSFNIKYRPDENQQVVSVKSGEVAVELVEENESPVSLVAGQQVSWDRVNEAWHLANVDPETIAFWTEGYLFFEDVAFNELLVELEKWFGVSFEWRPEDFDGCQITLKQKGESLKNILEILKYSINLNYRYKENIIMISGHC